jgi:hypothetical protein
MSEWLQAEADFLRKLEDEAEQRSVRVELLVVWRVCS